MLGFVSDNITLATSVLTFQSDMDDWIQRLRSIPSTEEIGRPEGHSIHLNQIQDAHFSIDRKIQLVSSLIAANKALSHSWPGTSPRIVALTAYATELKTLASEGC